MNQAPPKTTTRNCACGCVLGCLGLILLGFGLSSLSAWWLFTAPDQDAACRLAGAESIGIIELQLDVSDPGVAELLEAVIEAAEPNSSVTAADLAILNRFLPRDACVVFESGPQPKTRAAINFRAFTRLIELALKGRIDSSDGGVSVHRYRGTNLLITRKGPDFAFSGGTLVLAGGLTELELAVDRAIDGPGEASPMRDRLSAIGASGDELRMVLGNRELIAFFAAPLNVSERERVLIERLIAVSSGLDLGFDLISAERARLHVELSYLERGHRLAEEPAEAMPIRHPPLGDLKALVELEAERLAPSGLHLQIDRIEALDQRLILDLELIGVSSFLEWLLGEGFEELVDPELLQELESLEIEGLEVEAL